METIPRQMRRGVGPSPTSHPKETQEVVLNARCILTVDHSERGWRGRPMPSSEVLISEMFMMEIKLAQLVVTLF